MMQDCSPAIPLQLSAIRKDFYHAVFIWHEFSSDTSENAIFLKSAIVESRSDILKI